MRFSGIDGPALHGLKAHLIYLIRLLVGVAIDSTIVNSYLVSAIGFFLGFAFGVGCALAVMYSIYMGGYRAAVRESSMAAPPKRYIQALERIARTEG